MEKINIVVLSEDLDLRIHMKNLINGDTFAISAYSDFGDKGKLKTENMYPDIVICAVRGSVDNKIFEFVQRLLSVVHNCVIILANDKIDVTLVNKAAQYGIRKVLPLDDISSDDFTNEIRLVFQLERQRALESNEEKKVRSKVLAFFGGKGGTGKTTLSVNIACDLAKAGKRVMLIDLDLQFGDVALALDLEAKNSIVDLVQDRSGITIENINNFAVEHGTGISVLCAPASPEFAEFVKPEHVEKIIDVARPFFEYIILDMPPAFNDISITACESCEEIYLVYNTEILSLRNAKVCQSILEQLQQKEKIRIILNKTEKGLITVKDYENMFMQPVFFTIPMDTKVAAISINKGQPLIVAQPRSALAGEINDLTDKIIEIHTGITPLTVKERKKKKKIDAKILKEKKNLEKITAKERKKQLQDDKKNSNENNEAITNKKADEKAG